MRHAQLFGAPRAQRPLGGRPRPAVSAPPLPIFKVGARLSYLCDQFLVCQRLVDLNGCVCIVCRQQSKTKHLYLGSVPSCVVTTSALPLLPFLPFHASSLRFRQAESFRRRCLHLTGLCKVHASASSRIVGTVGCADGHMTSAGRRLHSKGRCLARAVGARVGPAAPPQAQSFAAGRSALGRRAMDCPD